MKRIKEKFVGRGVDAPFASTTVDPITSLRLVHMTYTCRILMTLYFVKYKCLSGNPGIADYYAEFMKSLYQWSGARTSVWCVSHAGHVDHTKLTNHSESHNCLTIN